MQNVKKKFLKEIKKSKKISWQNPLKIAQKISQNYQENWVFLYSALHQEKKNSKSFIALFENQQYCGNDFKELQKIIEKSGEEIWFGGLSYELANQFEDLPKIAKSFIEIEEIFFSKFELILEFNHDKQQLTAIYKNKLFLDKLLEYKLLDENHQLPIVKKISTNFSDESYKSTINSLKNMIMAGDFFQANLTRKFFGKFQKKLSQNENFKLFLELTKQSPANYSAFIRFNDNFIISSSPELFLKSRNKNIFSCPIKGTIKRGNNPQEDKNNKKYLKNSIKEKAENLMIVDLVRNDLSRVCEPSTIKVKKLFNIATYKTIYHLSSEIHGKIAQQFSVFDAIRTCFPAGSMTGAPKIKSMEVLSDLEKINRGIYSGAIGYFKKNEINLAVVIRTLIVKKDCFEFQVGGAITFDSDAELELEETYSKASAIMKILKLKKINFS
jgi:para-aminobenzoate synthetase component I